MVQVVDLPQYLALPYQELRVGTAAIRSIENPKSKIQNRLTTY